MPETAAQDEKRSAPTTYRAHVSVVVARDDGTRELCEEMDRMTLSIAITARSLDSLRMSAMRLVSNEIAVIGDPGEGVIGTAYSMEKEAASHGRYDLPAL